MVRVYWLCALENQAVDCRSSGGQYPAFYLSPGCFSELCSRPTLVQQRSLAVPPAQERDSSPSSSQRELEAPPS